MKMTILYGFGFMTGREKKLEKTNRLFFSGVMDGILVLSHKNATRHIPVANGRTELSHHFFEVGENRIEMRSDMDVIPCGTLYLEEDGMLSYRPPIDSGLFYELACATKRVEDELGKIGKRLEAVESILRCGNLF